MSTFSVSMVRDEVDVIEATLRHTAKHVDHLIVADNGSVDGTRDVLADLTRDLPLTVLDDPEIGYFQSAKMTKLAHLAGGMGAVWVVPVDADEAWYSRDAPRIADTLAGVAAQWLAVAADLFDHVPTASDGHAESHIRRIGYRRKIPAPLRKVAVRVRPDLRIEQGNHSATYDGGTSTLDGLLVVRHYPYRSPEQFVSKARNGAQAYAATELPWEFGQHWREYGQILDNDGPEALHGVFHRWFWSEDPAHDDSLIFDPCP